MKDSNENMLYIIKGKVIHGDGYGKKLGFPTINLDTDGADLPPAGVYAGTALLENKNYRAGIVIHPDEKVDAHLIGYAGNAYGKEVTLETKEFLRESKKFDTEKELVIQIRTDLEKC